MKGAIKPDIMPVNKYKLLIFGMPDFTFTKLSGLEVELEKTVLPDRTVQSGGNTKASEFTGMLPMHHAVEQIAMQAWLKSAKDPVAPDYKKVATLIHISNSGIQLRTYQLTGLFPFKEKQPDKEMKNEGEMAENEWSFSVDDVQPIT